jgi:hypothetical protein
MAQFDVHRNPGQQTDTIPDVVVPLGRAGSVGPARFAALPLPAGSGAVP